jgi:hypothetical protein
MSYRRRRECGIPLLLSVHRRLLLHVIPHHHPAIIIAPPPPPTVRRRRGSRRRIALARLCSIAGVRRRRRQPHLPPGVLRHRALPSHDPLHCRKVAEVAVAVAVWIAILRKRSPVLLVMFRTPPHPLLLLHDLRAVLQGDIDVAAVAAVIAGGEKPGPCALVSQDHCTPPFEASCCPKRVGSFGSSTRFQMRKVVGK